jgi:NAD(P)-dependent dehydrogenase (short-subunit alcohol dehydrogenase family)
MKRIALITGASRGLGATLARHLAAQDFALVLTSRTAHQLERLADELSDRGTAVRALSGDIVEHTTRLRLVEAARDLGGLDILVNNASELGGIGPLDRMAATRLIRVLLVNVVAPIALTSAALPLLTARKGLVINVSSDAAAGAYSGWGAYGASKAALDLATRTFAGELASSEVGVIAVDPGDMRTDMHQQAFPGQDISDRPLPHVTLPFWDWVLAQRPMHVTGQRFAAQQHATEEANA